MVNNFGVGDSARSEASPVVLRRSKPLALRYEQKHLVGHIALEAKVKTRRSKAVQRTRSLSVGVLKDTPSDKAIEQEAKNSITIDALFLISNN